MPPISRETFQKLREQGYTIEQIAEAEKIRLSNEQQPIQQQPTQQQSGLLQQLGQGFKNIGAGIVNPPYRIAARALQGIESLATGKQASTYKNPLTGDVVDPYTTETPITEPIGLGLQGAAMTMGGSPALAGAAYGAGAGMEAQKSGLEITGQAALGMALGTVAGLVSGQYKLPDIEKLAGKVINSLIKPSHKDFLFGKNPGLGVAKEKIVATSMDDLAAKVDQRIDVLYDGVKTIRNTPENITKTVDLNGIKKPLIKSVIELRKAPKIHSAEITNLENALSDIGKLHQGNLNKLSVSEAYEIKGVISKMQKWTTESKAGTNLNKALKQVYHFVDDQIDNVIPELKELNSRMANLISARQAINNRVEVLQRQEPANWSGLLNLPFTAYRSVVSKTLLGKLLAKGYKNIK